MYQFLRLCDDVADPQPFFLHKYICGIPNLVQFILINVPNLNKEINNASKVGVTMWQTLDLGETFVTFCWVVGTAGVVSYFLIIFHLYIAPA